MSPYVLSIALVIAANVGYHLFQKTIRPDVIAPASLVVTYVVAGEPLGPVMAARDAFLDEHRAASTL